MSMAYLSILREKRSRMWDPWFGNDNTWIGNDNAWFNIDKMVAPEVVAVRAQELKEPMEPMEQKVQKVQKEPMEPKVPKEPFLSTDAKYEIFGGAIAGGVSTIVGEPIDTIKVRMQTHPNTFPNVTETIRKTWTVDGPRGFFRGLMSPLASQMAVNATIFFTYGRTLEYMSEAWGVDKTTISAQMGAGAVAGAVQTAVLNPFDVVKCQMQAASKALPHLQGVTLPKPRDVVRTLWTHRGVLGFYQGVSATLWRETTSFALYFGAYETTRKWLSKTWPDMSTLAVSLLSGSVAGLAVWGPPYPFDLVKSRIQVIPWNRTHGWRSTSTWVHMRDVVRERGIGGLWRGVSATLLRAVPVNAILFMTMQALRDQKVFG